MKECLNLCIFSSWIWREISHMIKQFWDGQKMKMNKERKTNEPKQDKRNENKRKPLHHERLAEIQAKNNLLSINFMFPQVKTKLDSQN